MLEHPTQKLKLLGGEALQVYIRTTKHTVHTQLMWKLHLISCSSHWR